MIRQRQSPVLIRQYPKNTHLKVPPEKETEIGIWGQRYRRYLKQHHRIRYYNLLTAGTLNGHLAEVEQQAEQMFRSRIRTFQAGKYHGKAESRSPHGVGAKDEQQPEPSDRKRQQRENLHMRGRKYHLYLSEDAHFRTSCGRKGAIPTPQTIKYNKYISQIKKG